MAERHRIHLKTPEGLQTVECPPDEFILDVAAQQGIPLPAVCRGGACSTCIGRLVEGVPPDQSEQNYLNEDDLSEGYVLLCVAYARGECTLETHKNAEFSLRLCP